MIRKLVLVVVCGLLPLSSFADESASQAGVYNRVSELAPAQLWQRLNVALTEYGFGPVYEVDGNAELARYQAWGLEAAPAGLGARSLSFSSDSYSQRLGDLDHRLLESFPLSVTVVASESGSQVLLPRPTAAELPAGAVTIASTLEEALVQTIESALTVGY